MAKETTSADVSYLLRKSISKVRRFFSFEKRNQSHDQVNDSLEKGLSDFLIKREINKYFLERRRKESQTSEEVVIIDKFLESYDQFILLLLHDKKITEDYYEKYIGKVNSIRSYIYSPYFHNDIYSIRMIRKKFVELIIQEIDNLNFTSYLVKYKNQDRSLREVIKEKVLLFLKLDLCHINIHIIKKEQNYIGNIVIDYILKSKNIPAIAIKQMIKFMIYDADDTEYEFIFSNILKSENHEVFSEIVDLIFCKDPNIKNQNRMIKFLVKENNEKYLSFFIKTIIKRKNNNAMHAMVLYMLYNDDDREYEFIFSNILKSESRKFFSTVIDLIFAKDSNIKNKNRMIKFLFIETNEAYSDFYMKEIMKKENNNFFYCLFSLHNEKYYAKFVEYFLRKNLYQPIFLQILYDFSNEKSLLYFINILFIKDNEKYSKDFIKSLLICSLEKDVSLISNNFILKILNEIFINSLNYDNEKFMKIIDIDQWIKFAIQHKNYEIISILIFRDISIATKVLQECCTHECVDINLFKIIFESISLLTIENKSCFDDLFNDLMKIFFKSNVSNKFKLIDKVFFESLKEFPLFENFVQNILNNNDSTSVVEKSCLNFIKDKYQELEMKGRVIMSSLVFCELNQNKEQELQMKIEETTLSFEEDVKNMRPSSVLIQLDEAIETLLSSVAKIKSTKQVISI